MKVWRVMRGHWPWQGPRGVDEMPRRIQIMVVEDNHAVLRRLVDLLERAPGLMVAGQAADCARAQTRLRERPVDVLVCDIRIPPTDGLGNGLDLIHWALASESARRAIVLTNFDDPAYRQAAARVGAAAFLDKSADLGRLVHVIYEVAARTS